MSTHGAAAAAADADLLGIGQHCSHADCGALDFLPFKCDACSKVFCLDHRSYASHACAAAPARSDLLVIVCPVCAESVRLAPGEDPNAAFDRHMRAGGCNPENYARAASKPRCPARGCKEKLTAINQYECKTCRQSVCMRHRHGDDHQCPGRPTVAKRLGGVTAAVGAGARGLVERIGRAAAPPAAAAAPAGPAGAVRKAAAARAPAAAAAAASDPLNSVRGTAERRRAALEEQQRAAAAAAAQRAGGGWLSSLWGASGQQQHHHHQHQAEVIDLTGGSPAAHSQQRQQQATQQQPGGRRHEYACHRCGAGFDDPVALISHDAACSAAAGGAAPRAAACRLS